MIINYQEQIIQELSISLPASKSISNRALIVQALCQDSFIIQNLSEADDTQILLQNLRQKSLNKHVGLAGTTARFLSAFLATQKATYFVDAANKMKERPMLELFTALAFLGAEITYLEKNGTFPYSINGSLTKGGKIQISAKSSSQFASALILIAPVLESGLEIEMIDEISSRPYIEMTLKMLSYFGVQSNFSNNIISISQQKYQAKDLTIEADWSAASYFYSCLALMDEGSFILNDLKNPSWQGDSIVSDIYYRLGVKTTMIGESVLLEKSENKVDELTYDFSACPDLAQTVICTCVGLGITGNFSGLQTLIHKETNRILALQKELAKFGWDLLLVDDIYELRRKTTGRPMGAISVMTYNDHRMAMSFAPLCIVFGELEIEDEEVVSKSFPKFWEQIAKIGIR